MNKNLSVFLWSNNNNDHLLNTVKPIKQSSTHMDQLSILNANHDSMLCFPML